MKSVLKLALLTTLLALSIGASEPNSGRRFVAKIEMSEFRQHINDIRKAGIDVAGMNLNKQKVDLLVNSADLETLRQMGVQATRNLKILSADAPDSKYKTPDQVAQILQEMQKTYPDLAQVKSIGKSFQGRDIYSLRITQHVAQADGKKPTILYNGMHHAREVMSTEVPLDIANTLLSQYGKDSKVTHWVDSNVIYIVPMINVDGNNIVWTEDNMWRKNARKVDINRNYPYQWNSCNGSSDSEGADDYHGPSAASEPETNVFMNFVTSIHPVFSISFHSYSEIVIYPYGCGAHTETADVVEPLGKQMASLIQNDSESGTYTAGLAPELLYSVDGDDIDWMYHEEHVIPFVIEVNSDDQGFQPSYDDWRDKTVSKIRPAWELLLDRLDHSSVQGQVSVPQGLLMAFNTGHRARVVIQGQGLQSGFVQTYPIHADGSFHAILNPGDYAMTITGVGIKSQQRVIHVQQDRLKLNIALSRD